MYLPDLQSLRSRISRIATYVFCGCEKASNCSEMIAGFEPLFLWQTRRCICSKLTTTSLLTDAVNGNQRTLRYGLQLSIGSRIIRERGLPGARFSLLSC